MAKHVDTAVKSQGHGKLVRACVVVEAGRAETVTFTGDFFLEPAEVLEDLGAAMSGATLEDAGDRARAFFGGQTRMMLVGAGPEDFAAAVIKALEQEPLSR